VSGAGWPARYEIRVESALHERWSAWFDGLGIEVVDDATVLRGSVPDLSALHAILDKICDLGLTVISVRRVPPEDELTLGGR
jgi:hypothetical protein